MTSHNKVTRDQPVRRIRAPESTKPRESIHSVGRVRSTELLVWDRHHEATFENSAVPMYIHDLETLAFLKVNDAAVRSYGYTREEFFAMTAKDIRPPEFVPPLLETVNTPADHMIHRGLRRHLKKSGEPIDVEVLLQDVLLDNRRVRLVIPIDVTDQKRAEQERLAHAIHQRDALVKEVHHRIKNHLQGIAGLLRNKIGDHPATERLIEEAITQLQSVGAVYGLQSEPAEGGVPLYRVVEAVCASVESLSSGSVERRFSVAGTGALWLAETEAVPVAVALNELVFNAIKHCATRDGERSIEVALTERNNDAEIRIVNRGRLSANFDYVRGVGTGTGLELVKTLLSPGGSKLAFDVRGDTVEASLRLRPPLVATRTAKAVA